MPLTDQEAQDRAVALDVREALLRSRERVVVNILRDLKALQETIDEYIELIEPLKPE